MSLACIRQAAGISQGWCCRPCGATYAGAPALGRWLPQGLPSGTLSSVGWFGQVLRALLRNRAGRSWVCWFGLVWHSCRFSSIGLKDFWLYWMLHCREPTVECLRQQARAEAALLEDEWVLDRDIKVIEPGKNKDKLCFSSLAWHSATPPSYLKTVCEHLLHNKQKRDEERENWRYSYNIIICTLLYFKENLFCLLFILKHYVNK